MEIKANDRKSKHNDVRHISLSIHLFSASISSVLFVLSNYKKLRFNYFQSFSFQFSLQHNFTSLKSTSMSEKCGSKFFETGDEKQNLDGQNGDYAPGKIELLLKSELIYLIKN